MSPVDRGLSLLLERLVRAVYQGRHAGDLQPVQWAALRYFARAGRKTRTVAGLAGYLGVTRGPASRSTKRLLGRGYLAVEVDPEDRRVPLFLLTEEGREALSGDPIVRLAHAISGLSPDKKAAFASCLEALSVPLYLGSGHSITGPQAQGKPK